MSYTFEERAKRRKTRLKTVAANAQTAIKSLWQDLEHAPGNAPEQYSHIFSKLEMQFTETKHYRAARYQFLKFIRDYNSSNIGAEYPEPSVPILLKRTPPVISHSWFEHGKEAKQLQAKAIDHWEKTDKYSTEETLGWLIFSAIMGGLNDQPGLLSLVKAVLERKPLTVFGPDNDIICLTLDIEDSSYGNDIRQTGLYRSFFYAPDTLTQIWLSKAYALEERYSEPLDTNVLLETALRPISAKYRAPNLLRAADYIWGLKPNVTLCPTLIRVMQGKTKTCSLSVRELARFFKAYQPVSNAVLYQPEKEMLILQKEPIKKNNSVTHLSDSILNKIKTSLDAPLSHRTDRLTLLLEGIEHEGSRRLIFWIISLTTGSKGKVLKNSSILRYMSSVAHPWISLTADVDILDFDSSDYEDLYHEIIATRPVASKAFDAGRLMQFHYFMMRKCSAPAVVLEYVNHQDICSARVVSPSLFFALIQTVKAAAIINEADKNTLVLIYTLAYRTGMRREEIMGIQLRDIEAVTLENNKVLSFSLLIRANRISSIKSSSAFRRIRLSALLKPDELHLMLEHWYKQRRLKHNQPNIALFTLANSDSPLPGHFAYSVLRSALNAVVGEHGYTFHSFRHTALSNLAVVLQSDFELIKYLTDYSEADVERIKQGLLGTVDSGSDSWNALAQMAGHLTPQQTFQSYVHFAHIQAGWQLCRSNDSISFKAIEKLTGFSERKLYRLITPRSSEGTKATRSTTKTLHLQNLLSALTRELKNHIRSWDDISKELLKNRIRNFTASKSNATLGDKSPAELMLSTLPGSFGNPLEMDEAYYLIKQLEVKHSVESISQDYSVPQQLLEQWQNRAIELRELTTRNEQPRLFSSERFESNTDGLLLPAPLHNTSLTVQAGKMLNNAIILYEKKPDRLRWFLNVFLAKTQPTRSELYFSGSEFDDLKSFLQIAELLFDAAQWRLRSTTPERTRALKLKLKLNTRFSIDKQAKPNYTGIAVSLKTPDESQILNKKGSLTKYSSAALKYVCHMLLITLPVDTVHSLSQE